MSNENSPAELMEKIAPAIGDAAFIRELLRKAAVFAAIESDGDLVLNDGHIEQALSELLVAGGAITQSLLGA